MDYQQYTRCRKEYLIHITPRSSGDHTRTKIIHQTYASYQLLGYFLVMLKSSHNYAPV